MAPSHFHVHVTLKPIQCYHMEGPNQAWIPIWQFHHQEGDLNDAYRLPHPPHPASLTYIMHLHLKVARFAHPPVALEREDISSPFVFHFPLRICGKEAENVFFLGKHTGKSFFYAKGQRVLGATWDPREGSCLLNSGRFFSFNNVTKSF